jgi:hypothetical protein
MKSRFANTDELLSTLDFSRHRDDSDEGPPPDINLSEIKDRALSEVRKQNRRFQQSRQPALQFRPGEMLPPSYNMIVCTKTFMDFYQSDLCHGMVVAAIYYVSSTLWLQGQGPPLDDAAIAQQEHNQADSLRVLSSFYCQLLLSPVSGHLRVREERIFYETVIFFLDACACFAIRTENPDAVYELLGKLFRKDLQDPRVRQPPEFLPITEIVRRHWLSQRVPGKTRAEISPATLRGTTKLIEPLCRKERPATSRDEVTVFDIWQKNGLPQNTTIPVGAAVIAQADIIDLTPPKQSEGQVAEVLAAAAASAEAATSRKSDK